eukprot:CAMPEP_0196698012 /NCGR_PEP_ID=MMETSP1090-20130531/43454_1 /TAXON_ID=37098 /ORGANISM="Isochrysis sp, Strain CCMP1244" /LENGTH=89 /DNA_ID=CAMNT_0042037657 /DNA_START=70 /DNA_END=336 /DNA_ORIENTATION=+
MCDLGRVKHMMHVVSPPRVDSGSADWRPVSKLASASEIAAAGVGCGSLDEGTGASNVGGEVKEAATPRPPRPPRPALGLTAAAAAAATT